MARKSVFTKFSGESRLTGTFHLKVLQIFCVVEHFNVQASCIILTILLKKCTRQLKFTVSSYISVFALTFKILGINEIVAGSVVLTRAFGTK